MKSALLGAGVPTPKLNTQTAFPLDGREVLVKFMFFDRQYLPAGLREVVRASDKKMDERHAADVGYQAEGAVGRHRNGRVDTGEPVIKRLHRTSPFFLMNGLEEVDYVLTDAHYFRKENRDEMGRPRPQYVIVLNYKKGGKRFTLTPELEDSLLGFFEGAAWSLDVWKNSDPKPHTINFIKPTPQIEPDYELAVESGNLVAVYVKDHLAELPKGAQQ